MGYGHGIGGEKGRMSWNGAKRTKQVGGKGGVVNEVVPDYREANELTIVGLSTEDQVRLRGERRMESQVEYDPIIGCGSRSGGCNDPGRRPP